MVSQFNAMKAKPLTLALSQRERGLTELSWCCTPTCDFSGELRLAKPEITSIIQVDVTRKITTVSPLSLRERVRVRRRLLSAQPPTPDLPPGKR
ncbi:hypothetical protein BJN42_04235 [Pseudomonas koreensis]|nr:hypothetical protein BJN42_04235 [Pseudomonas koreensis]